MDVNIRHINEAEGDKFCEIGRPDELPGIAKTLSEYGIHDKQASVDYTDAACGFIYDNGKLIGEITFGFED